MTFEEHVKRVVAWKFHKYETDMEGADWEDFIRAEWAAGAMRQLYIDLFGVESLVGGMPPMPENNNNTQVQQSS